MAILRRPKHSHRWLRMLCVVILLFPAIGADAEMVDGFVTRMDSATAFDVGALHIVMDGKTQCETGTLDSNIQLKGKTYDGLMTHRYLVLKDHPDPRSMRPSSCESLLLKVGSHVQIIGNAKQGKGSYFASQVIVYCVNVRQTFESEVGHREWESGALLEEAPKISKMPRGWVGSMWLDGYPMSITPSDTTLLTAPSGTQMSYRPFGLFSAPRMGATLSQSPSPAFSATLFQPNMWATYRGLGKVDGRVLLYRIRLWPNQIDTKEKEYLTQFTPAINTPDYSNHIPGGIKLPKTRADKILKIIPDQGVQDFVSNLGISLIPQYQKELPESDATKIHFRFYVVHPVGTTLNDERYRINGVLLLLSPGGHEATAALPNGLIVIPDRTLARIDNEAQLAAILSDAITSVLQKHGYITRYAHPDYTFEVDAPDFSPLVFAIFRTEQAMRIGVRQMYLAGYDIREAPFAWAAAAGKSVVNPVMNPKYPNEDIPWETAYAFDYISQYYSDADYSKLKKGEAEYAQFLDELRRADPEAFEKK